MLCKSTICPVNTAFESAKPGTSVESAGQMEDAKSKKKKVDNVPAIINSTELNDQYAASYLKTGSARGVMYQMKLLTWVTWKLMCINDSNINKWWLATEVSDAHGFHDLVLKYAINDTSKGDGSTSEKYMYRFVQMKHKRSLEKNATITDYHLTSRHKLHRQGSLIYLYKCYIDMLDQFEKITPEQIIDLTIFTNITIKAFEFLVPVKNDELYGFKGKGKKYRLDIRKLQKEPGIMVCLQNIKPYRGDNFIFDFLRKLVFMVEQPSEHELEDLIVAEMSNTFNIPQIFYDNLFNNIIKWFLIYEQGRAPYLTEDHVMSYLKETQDLLWKAKETEMLIDSVSKLSDKLKALSL